MLEHISVETVNEIAALARDASDAQDRLINKMKIMDRNDDGDLTMEQIGDNLATLDATADSEALLRLRERVRELSNEERLELMAAMYVGRGDFAAREWDEAMAQARADSDTGDVERIVEKASLHDDLKKALYELGLA